MIDPGGRFVDHPPIFADRLFESNAGVRRLSLLPDDSLALSQFDIRELQKAKGAIRASLDILLDQLNLKPADLQRMILTGSFGGQVNVDAVLDLGMLPPVPPEVVESVPNGAGFGAAMFLTDEGFALGLELAERAEQVDLDMDPDFNMRYVTSLGLTPNGA